MPRKRFPPLDPREWLNRARSNLARARKTLPQVYLEDLCFDAQQAVEKAIKAILLHYGMTFPYIHDLAQLLTLLHQGGVKIPKYVVKAASLTRFAVEARYPGLSGPVTEREHRRTVLIAEAVLRWAERKIVLP